MCRYFRVSDSAKWNYFENVLCNLIEFVEHCYDELEDLLKKNSLGKYKKKKIKKIVEVSILFFSILN